jgi:hypothetical protein
MFLTLLTVVFVCAFATSLLVAQLFRRPLDSILHRILGEEVSSAWRTFMTFAIFVVGVSSGVRIWSLERYLASPGTDGRKPFVLDADRWVLEVFRTIVETLQGIAWMLLVFFLFTLLAYVIVRSMEQRKRGADAGPMAPKQS